MAWGTGKLVTEAQSDYADVLVDKLKRMSHLQARRFERDVEECTDRGVMSDLISKMKAIVDAEW